MTTVSNELYNVANAAGNISGKADTLKKASKTVISGLMVSTDIAKCVSVDKVGTVLEPLGGALSNTVRVINAVGMFSTLWTFINPKEREAVLKSWEKTACKATLLAAQTLELTRFIDSVSVGFFTRPSNSLGNVAIFDIVKNALFAASSAFCIAHASKDLKKAKGSIQNAQDKRGQWEDKREKLDPDQIQGIFDKYQEKLANIGSSKEIKKVIDDLSGKVKQAQKDLKNAKGESKKTNRELIKNHANSLADAVAKYPKALKLEAYVQALSDEGTRTENTQKLIDHKIEVYNTRENNAKALEKKSWITIAAEIGKIFMIVVGMLVVGLSFLFPVLRAPAISLALSIAGLAANGAGLAMNLYRDVWYQAQVKAEPRFQLEATTA